jgi:hypothetical protein
VPRRDQAWRLTAACGLPVLEWLAGLSVLAEAAPKPNARTAAIFVDELDPTGLEGGSDFLCRFCSTAKEPVRSFEPLNGWDRQPGLLR